MHDAGFLLTSYTHIFAVCLYVCSYVCMCVCVGGREQKCYSSKPKHASSCPVGFGLLFFIYTGSMGCVCVHVSKAMQVSGRQ